MDNTQETSADIIAEARDKYTVHECNQCTWRKCCSKGFESEECGKLRESLRLKLGIEDGYFTQLLDRLEAAHKREADSIHRAMVLITGIEMEDSEDPPRLWTALEDAYDALSDALGTDGDATADAEEAEATGRHFIVESTRNAAAMREALEHVGKLAREFAVGNYYVSDFPKMLLDVIQPALAAPPRNCDVGTAEEQAERYVNFCQSHNKCGRCPCAGQVKYNKCEFAWAQMPYEEGGVK